VSAVHGFANPTRVRVQRVAHGQVSDDWRHTMLHWPERVERVLKADGGSRVVLLRLGERRVVLKLILMRGWMARARTWLGMTRHHRQWQGAEWVRAAWTGTSEPLAIGTIETADINGIHSHWQWLGVGYLVGPTLLDALRDAQRMPPNHRRRREHALAVAAGGSVRKLTRAGLLNRDHKPSNLIVLRSDPRHIHAPVGVIDTVGIRRTLNGKLDRSALERMLASLIIEAIGCGVFPSVWSRRAAVRVAMGAWDPRMSTMHVWRAVRRIIERHGDPTPKVDPLSPTTNASDFSHNDA
jgi:hypothetical protein